MAKYTLHVLMTYKRQETVEADSLGEALAAFINGDTEEVEGSIESLGDSKEEDIVEAICYQHDPVDGPGQFTTEEVNSAKKLLLDRGLISPDDMSIQGLFAIDRE